MLDVYVTEPQALVFSPPGNGSWPPALIPGTPPTLDALSGGAAVGIASCAMSGSVLGATTSRSTFLGSTPSTSRVLVGRQVNPSSRTDRPPVASRAGAFGPAARSYISRPTETSRPHSIANRSGSSLDRSSLRGPRVPPTCPAVRAFGLHTQPRHVLWSRVVATANRASFVSCHSDIPVLAANRSISSESATTRSQMVARDIPPTRDTSRTGRDQVRSKTLCTNCFRM